MPEPRPVVIADVSIAVPVTDRESGQQAVENSISIWVHRAEQLQASLVNLQETPTQLSFAVPFPAVYFRDPVIDLPAVTIASLPVITFTTSERIALHLIEQLVSSFRELPGLAHISIGDPRDDINKQTLLALIGVVLPQALYPIVMDPLGLGAQTGLRRKPSIEIVTDASASGAAALTSGMAHIERGTVDSAVVVSSSGKTLPIPSETFPLGFGVDRSALPFEDTAAGHYYSEGGVGFVLHDADFARRHGVRPLGRILANTFGSFGASVVNRRVLAQVIENCLDLGRISPDTPVFIDLYGRGNAVDDAAELSAIEIVAKSRPGVQSGYLKGDSHYIIGSHGLLGLARLLKAKRDGQDVSALASHPESARLRARPRMHLSADPATFSIFVFVTFSVHGSCVATLVSIDEDLI